MRCAFFATVDRIYSIALVDCPPMFTYTRAHMRSKTWNETILFFYQQRRWPANSKCIEQTVKSENITPNLFHLTVFVTEMPQHQLCEGYNLSPTPAQSTTRADGWKTRCFSPAHGHDLSGADRSWNRVSNTRLIVNIRNRSYIFGFEMVYPISVEK